MTITMLQFGTSEQKIGVVDLQALSGGADLALVGTQQAGFSSNSAACPVDSPLAG